MAKEVGGQLGIPDFIYSTGWLNRFKQNHEYSEHIKRGKMTGINVESLRSSYC
jgi:hypothetical protein